MGDVKTSYDPDERKARDLGAAAQGADTFKGDLVADELAKANAAKAKEAVAAKDVLEAKFGPSLADVKSQTSFIVIERAELQRRSAASTKGTMMGPLSAIALDWFKGKKE